MVANTGTMGAPLLGAPNDLTQSLRSGRSGSFGDLSISDFECDESDRISDFSFESRLDSVY